MEVIDNRPRAWFLLREGGDYYLDINASQGIVSYSFRLRLTPEETQGCLARGGVYLDELSEKINYSIRDYQSRDLAPAMGERVDRAILTWRASHSDASI